MNEATLEVVSRDGDTIALSETMLRAMPRFAKMEDGGFEGVMLAAVVPDDFREGGGTLRLVGRDDYSVDVPLGALLERAMLAHSHERRPLSHFRLHIPGAAQCGQDVLDNCARVKDIVRIEVH